MTLKQNNLIGLILIIVGGLALLGNFGLLGGVPALFFSAAIGAAGVYLIRYHLTRPKQFWGSIVGFALLGLAFAAISGRWDGFFFLGLLGGGFATTYVAQRKQWWAVIPAGVLWTLSLVVASNNLFPRWDEGTLFFAGLAATFGYLFAYERQRWAIFPAVALLVVGVLSLSFTGGWVFPALLIAAGVYAMKRQQKETVKTMPVVPTTIVPETLTTETLAPATVDSMSGVDKSREEEPITRETLAQKLEEVSPGEDSTDTTTDKQN
jgi:hypothetical protein